MEEPIGKTTEEVEKNIVEAVRQKFDQTVEEVTKSQLSMVKMDITRAIYQGIAKFTAGIEWTEDEKYYVFKIPK